MPELFRQYGFIFLFFSREHEPIHVHVRGQNGDAKFVWKKESFELESVNNIKANDLKRIEKAVRDNADIILKRWCELFGAPARDDNNEDMV